MSARSVQAGQLGRDLARALGLTHVEIHWSGSRRRDGFGGWRVEWTDGPTVQTMRTLVERHATRFDAVPVADLGYDRCSTTLAEAIALLLYIDREHCSADSIEVWLVRSAFYLVDWPERADQVWHDRARALLHHTPGLGGGTAITEYAVRALAARARVGWAGALAWLDRLADEQAALAEATNVITLASRRGATGTEGGRGRHDWA